MTRAPVRIHHPSAVVLALALVAGAGHVQAAAQEQEAAPTTFASTFSLPGPEGQLDLSIENLLVDLLAKAAPGSTVRFAVNLWNLPTISNAMVAAAQRGVDVHVIVDRTQAGTAPVVRVRAELPPGNVTLCGLGTPYGACIGSDPAGAHHNKFATFSQLTDGRSHVVVQSTFNLTTSQRFAYNAATVISNAPRLHAAYDAYFLDMRSQPRVDDYYSGPIAGESTELHLSPRAAQDSGPSDTILDALAGISCASGGGPDGRGHIRVAHPYLTNDRIVVAQRLAELQGEGCTVEMITGSSIVEDAAMATVLVAGVRFQPFRDEVTATGRLVTSNNRYFLIDAADHAGADLRTVWTGSQSIFAKSLRSYDETLLRIDDPGTFDAYSANWAVLRERAVLQLRPRTADPQPPYTAATVSPAPNAAGWHRGDVTVRLASADNLVGSGVQELVVTLSGAVDDTFVVPAGANLNVVTQLVISAEGETTVTYAARDLFGNEEVPRTLTVRVDRTAPAIEGMPRAGCELWPPNLRMVHVATVRAADEGSGLAAPLALTAVSDESDDGDIDIEGGRVSLRAERDGYGDGRSYVITASAEDLAGNTTTVTGTCTVPLSQGAGPAGASAS